MRSRSTLTVHQDTMVLSVKSQCHEILWVIGSHEIEQTSARVIRITQRIINPYSNAYFDMVPVLHCQGIHLVDDQNLDG